MQTAYGGGSITTTAATLTTPGYSTLTLADALTSFAILLVSSNQYTTGTVPTVRTVYIPAVISGGKVKTSYHRAKDNRSYPATFTAVCPLSGIVITDVSSAHS